MPRTQLPLVRTNTTRIDGSPRVADLYGDFTGSGLRSFRHDPAVPEHEHAVGVRARHHAIRRIRSCSGSAASRAPGLTVGAGMLDVTPMAFLETNTGATAGIASTAVDVQTGATKWTFNYAYPAPRVAGHQTVPATGIPGGAVTADRSGDGYITDVVFGDLYGDLWELDPMTGAKQFARRCFSFSSDYHPIGASPRSTRKAAQQYAAFVTGGYADLSDSTWGTATQELVQRAALRRHLGFDVALDSGRARLRAGARRRHAGLRHDRYRATSTRRPTAPAPPATSTATTSPATLAARRSTSSAVRARSRASARRSFASGGSAQQQLSSARTPRPARP